MRKKGLFLSTGTLTGLPVVAWGDDDAHVVGFRERLRYADVFGPARVGRGGSRAPATNGGRSPTRSTRDRPTRSRHKPCPSELAGASLNRTARGARTEGGPVAAETPRQKPRSRRPTYAPRSRAGRAISPRGPVTCHAPPTCGRQRRDGGCLKGVGRLGLHSRDLQADPSGCYRTATRVISPFCLADWFAPGPRLLRTIEPPTVPARSASSGQRPCRRNRPRDGGRHRARPFLDGFIEGIQVDETSRLVGTVCPTGLPRYGHL